MTRLRRPDRATATAIGVLGILGLIIFFLVPVIPVQIQYNVPPGQDPCARYRYCATTSCYVRTAHYSRTELRSLGFELFGIGYRQIKTSSVLCYDNELV